MEDALQQGLASGLVLIIYGLIDKVITPLLSKNSKKATEDVQGNINENLERRIHRLEAEGTALSGQVGKITTSVAVSTEILKRIEGSLK
jgi:hypothetical protein